MTEKNHIVSPEINIPVILESLLFVAPGPVTINQLATTLEITPREVEKALASLEENYLSRGIRLQRHHGKIKLTSAPEAATLVEKFLDLEATSRLSRAALETLSIIAFQQPITRPQIDAIRGVNSDSVLRNLLSKGLAEEVGRSEGPGRPILYETTHDFLQHFGLRTLEELPQLFSEETLSEIINSQPNNGETANMLKD
ncbi:MAG: SMC-Scp complex subunit ScpB [Chloroflexi bacterium]|nr:SMC-Scp complex subunit ScpB [Chloroflexota bacterium]